MKKLIDLRVKANHAILDNFLIVPDTLTAKKTKNLANIKKLLRYEMKEKEKLI